MSQTLFLIDGNSIINRAYYGMAGRNSMTAPDKTPTGAIYGFLNIYLKHLQDYKPDKVCVCFDVKAKTFRHSEYAEYKAERKPMPEDLAVQIPILKEILDAMGVTRVEMEGYEADDLIGSVSAKAEQEEWTTFILSGDKDDFQLVSSKTMLLIPITKGGQTVTELYDPAAVEKKYSVTPSNFVELKAIMGDPSDNIPGVRGIGEKGATELISKYKTLEAVYNAIDDIKGSAAAKLKENKDMAFLSRKLSTIKRDIDVDFVFERMDSSEENRKEMFEIFRRLGFRSLISRLELSENEISDLVVKSRVDEGTIKPLIEADSEEIIGSVNVSDLYRFVSVPEFLITPESICFDKNYLTEETKRIFHDGYKHYISIHFIKGCGILIDTGDENHYITAFKDFAEIVKWAYENKVVLAGFDIKSVLKEIKSLIEPVCVFDIGVAGYLLSLSDSGMSFDMVAERVLEQGAYMPPLQQDNEKYSQQTFFDEIPAQECSGPSPKDRYDLGIIREIVDIEFKKLAESKLLSLALFVEMPLVRVLADMEKAGILVDPEILSDLNRIFSDTIYETESRIYELSGQEFNINSPKQLGDILFDKLGLPSGKKGKTGYSTNAEVLDTLSDKHPVIQEILRYRELSKLKSTFLDGLTKSIDPTDRRVHTTFNQTLTTTGRLSSSNPNIQNIPIKTETGREIRRAFIAGEGMMLADADYSQIELRLLADFSGDEQMCSAFRDNDDIHMRTAEEMFDLPREMITPSMRSMAKTINFSIVYGIGDFSLAKDLGITVAQAHKYIEEYHKKYPKVKPYLSSLLEKAYKDGYVETLFRRRRYVDELKSQNRNVRLFGERAAMNAPVQGSAADIIKIAMVILDMMLREEPLGARLVLQVHDELILEVPENEASRASEMLKTAMENAVRLSVPLIADAEIKKDWF